LVDSGNNTKSFFNSPKGTFLLALLLGVLAVIPFAESYYWDFVWDDLILIKNNMCMDQPDYLQKIWLTDFFKETSQPAVSYFWRPLVRFSMWSDYKIYGRDPLGFHLTNLILYALLVTIMFIFFRQFISLPASILAVLLFAWHPLRTETVAWISCRTEIMVLLFGVAALLFFYKSTSHSGPISPTFLIVSTLFLSLALLSKESAILFPLLALFVFPKNIRSHKIAYLLFLLPLTVWFVMRKFSVGYQHWFPQLVDKLLLPAAAARSLYHYTKVHLYPLGLSSEPWFDFPSSYLELHVITGFIIFICLLLIAVFQRNIIRAGALWFLIALTPFLHLLPLPERAADRYSTMASVGFVLIIAGLWDKFNHHTHNRFLRWGSFGALITIAIGWAVISWHLCPTWMTDQSIKIRSVIAGDSPQALYDRGTLALKGNDYKTAEACFTKALERSSHPTDLLLFSLAMTEIQLEKIPTARKHLAEVLNLNKAHPMAGMMLGELYMRSGQFDKALKLMASQSRRFPENPVPYVVTGQIYMDFLNNPAKAKKAFQKALSCELPKGAQRKFVEDRLRKLQ